MLRKRWLLVVMRKQIEEQETAIRTLDSNFVCMRTPGESTEDGALRMREGLAMPNLIGRIRRDSDCPKEWAVST